MYDAYNGGIVMYWAPLDPSSLQPGGGYCIAPSRAASRSRSMSNSPPSLPRTEYEGTDDVDS